VSARAGVCVLAAGLLSACGGGGSAPANQVPHVDAPVVIAPAHHIEWADDVWMLAENGMTVIIVGDDRKIIYDSEDSKGCAVSYTETPDDYMVGPCLLTTPNGAEYSVTVTLRVRDQRTQNEYYETHWYTVVDVQATFHN
jgi:hypothetical protein